MMLWASYYMLLLCWIRMHATTRIRARIELYVRSSSSTHVRCQRIAAHYSTYIHIRRYYCIINIRHASHTPARRLAAKNMQWSMTAGQKCPPFHAKQWRKNKNCMRLNVAARALLRCGAMLGEAARALTGKAQLPPQKEKQNKAWLVLAAISSLA